MILIYIPGRLSSRTLCFVPEVGWTLHPVPFIFPPQGKNVTSRFQDQYTKLNVWTLDAVEIRSLVYLDANTLVRRIFDELFALPFSFAAAPDVWENEPGFTLGFNAGVLFLRPSTVVFTDMTSCRIVHNVPE
jgi:alpha-N-acetylglucosamine transferase